MSGKKVLVTFNDDGSDKMTVGGKEVEFGSIDESVRDIAASLNEKGHDARVVPLRRDVFDVFVREITSFGQDIIFNVCEAAFGISSYEMNIAALYELYDLKYTGNAPFTLAVALNKGIAKDILRSRNVPTAAYYIAASEGEAVPLHMKFPMIVKPLREDASIGIDVTSVVKNEAELRARIAHVIKEHHQAALIEEYIEGREFNVSVMGPGDNARVLPPSEIDYTGYPAGLPKIISYEAKWIETSPLYIRTAPVCPANVDAELKGKLETVALAAFKALMCRDYARVDMRLGTDGLLRVLEVNPNPDISRDAGFARAARAQGWDYPALVDNIVKTALSRYGA
ncbi:MAG: ATP-grasp domain-containing protein [Deltaproteobacteria bacterium]|nr:ATP-grasp domain-containing protein [Deltaproteobacteria bacterium]